MRRRRSVLAGFPHHVTHRGNRKAPIFLEDDHYRFYLARIGQYTVRYRVSLLSYCLMTNHTHLIVIPADRTGLSRCMHDLDKCYADYFNKKHGLVGHLWQERFFSCVLDERHLWNAIRYVEQNPVRAGLVKSCEEYPWSSAPAHCGLTADPLLEADFPPRPMRSNWRTWLEEGLPESELQQIRSCTWKGIPFPRFCSASGETLGLSSASTPARTASKKSPYPSNRPTRMRGGGALPQGSGGSMRLRREFHGL